LNSGHQPHENGARGILLEQSFQQRKGRLLPGELAELHYELARVHSIAYARGSGQMMALKGGERPFLGNGVDAGLPPDKSRLRSPLPRPGNSLDLVTTSNHLQAAIAEYKAALVLQTNHLSAQLGLGWSLHQSGDTNSALPAYRKALSLAWER